MSTTLSEKEICGVCEKPILPGQAVHGVRRIHWACYKPTQEFPTVKEITDKMDTAMDNIRALLKSKGQ